MSTLTEGISVGDLVKYELPAFYCRETVTVKQNAGATGDYVVGTVMEADGTKKVPVATGANADSILLQKILQADIIAGDVEAPAMVRGSAIVDVARLTITAGQEASSKAALLALGIVQRAEPTKYEEGLATS